MKRTKKVMTILSDEEKAIVERNAKQERRTIADYIRFQIVKEPVVYISGDELGKVA